MATVSPAPRLSKNAGRKALFPVPLSSTRVSEPCWLCGTLITPRPDSESNYCRDCRRIQAESAVNELVGLAKALRDGTSVFAALTPDERKEQLVALTGASSLHDASASRCHFEDLSSDDLIQLAGEAAEEIARRLGSVPATAPARPRVREMTVTELAASEPLYVGGEAPDAATRDDLESRIEVTGDDAPPVDPYFHDLDLAVGVFPHVDPFNLADYAAKVCGFRPDFTPRPAA